MDITNRLVMEALDMGDILDGAGDRKGGDLAQDLASHLFAKIIMTRKRAPGPMMPTATQRVDHAANRRAADSLADSDPLGMIDPARRGERVTVTAKDVADIQAAADAEDVAAAQRAEADPSDPFGDLR